MADATLAILLKAKNDASAVFKAVEKDASSLGSRLGSSLKAGGLIAAGGIGVAGVALIGFTKAAAEEQVGVERLKQAVANTGVAYDAYAKQIDQAVRAGEKLAFSDDQIRDSLSALTTATGSVEEATKRQRIAMDLARGTGLDLATASKLVGKVSEENTQVLKRYGITLKDGATEQEALGEIQKRFAGQSETYASTAAAKWEIFGNQMDNIKESIGAALLPVVTQLGTALGEFLTRHQADIDRFSQALGEKIPAAIQAIRDGFEAVRPTLTYVFQQMREGFAVIQPGLEWIINNKAAMVAALTAIGIAMLFAFTPVTAPILAVTAAIGGLLFILGTSKEEWRAYGEALNQIWEDIQKTIEEKLGIIGTVIVAAMDLIRNNVETTVKVIRDIVVIVMALLQGDWSRAWEGVKQLARDILDGIVTDIRIKLGLLRDVFGAAMIAAYSAILAVWEEIRSFFADLPFKITTAIGDLYGVLKEFAKNAIQGFIDGILDKLEDVGAAVGSIASKVGEKFNEILRFGSPSRVTYQYGLDTMEGFRNGINDGAGPLLVSIDNIVQQVAQRIAAVREQIAAASSGDSGGDVNSDYGEREMGSGQRPQRVGGRTRDEWIWIFGASGIPREEYMVRIREMFGYRRGSLYVPQTGPAFLHQGEAVMPAEMAGMLRELLAAFKGGGQPRSNVYIDQYITTGDQAAGLAALMGAV